jgi:4-amino-4-deoxy-L-arabinose transferase-like glycosyltransferase
MDRRTLAAALLVFFTAFGVRTAMLAGMKPDRTLPDISEINNISLSVAREGVFGNPYAARTGPTAHSSPLYPSIKGGIYRLLGTGETGETACDLLSIFIAAVESALLPILATCFGLPLLVGVVAGLAGALLPIEFLTELRSYEALATVMLLGLTAVTFRTYREEGFSFSRGILHGLVWGLLALTHPVFVLVMAAWLTAAFLARRRHSARVAAYAAGALIAWAAVITPWAIRNYYALGEVVLFRSNFGIELYNANNPAAQVTFRDYVKSQAHADLHPSGNGAAAERLRTIGEPAYGRECTRAALEWIEANPGKFARLTVPRVVEFWFPSSNRRFQGPILGAISLVGLIGLYTLWRLRPEAALLFLLTYATFPLVYYVFNAEHRHSMPLQPFLLLSAALFVLQWPRRIQQILTRPLKTEPVS